MIITNPYYKCVLSFGEKKRQTWKNVHFITKFAIFMLVLDPKALSLLTAIVTLDKIKNLISIILCKPLC